MSTLDGSILNVALPTISDSLGASIETVAWVVLSYTLTLVSLMMIFGAWTERKGYLFAYQLGYAFFFMGSLACALSSSIELLIGARVIEAIGAAMFQAVGTGMVTTVFPAEERGKGIGLMVMMVSAGLMTGPPLGGFLLKFFPWQSIFLINLPIGVVGFFLARKYFRLLTEQTLMRRMNLPGGVAISIALLAGTLALSLLSDYGFGDIRIWGTALVAVAAFVAFIKLESNPEKAMIGLEIFKIRTFGTALVAALMMFIAMAGVLILMPFYLERIKGFGPSQVGMYLIILPALMFIIAPLSGKLSDKIGSRILSTVGMLVFGVGVYMLSRLGIGSTNHYIIYCLIVIGAGVSTFNTPNSSAMLGSVAPERRPLASSIISTTRNIGMSIGVALSTAMFAYFQERYAAAISDPHALFVAAYTNVTYVGLGVAVVALPFCLAKQR